MNSTGVFIGRFQPFHLGHYHILKEITQKHPLVYVLIVKGINTSLIKKINPFPFEIQKRIITSLFPQIKILEVVNAFLPTIIEEHKLEGDCFTLYSGPDRYTRYIAFKKWMDDLNLGFEVVSLDFDRENISGTNIRKALEENNFQSFMNMMPEEIWPMFNDLKLYVQ